MNELAKTALEATKAIRFEVSTYGTVADEGTPAYSQQVLPRALFQNTRGYIERIANQINGCYEKGWFDACAVMIRRLLETLIIECFEHHRIAHKIQGTSGDFLYLGDLVQKTLAEPGWNLGRTSKSALRKLKDVGDRSAHSRRYVARRWDIDKIIDDLRIVGEEFIYLAQLK